MAPEPWRSWLQETVQREAGRVLALAVGVPCLLIGALTLALADAGRAEGGVALLTAGVVLCAIGCYRVRRIKFPGGEIEADNTARYAIGDEVDVEEDSVEDAARYFIADRALRLLLTPDDGPLAKCRLHLYVHDEDEDVLLPVFETEERKGRTQGWRPGRGATGLAFARRQFVYASGDSVADGAFGLDSGERARYRNLTAVAAAPVLNAEDRCIAVLSAASITNDHELDTAEAAWALVALATGIARILVDLLGWFSDDNQEVAA